MPETLYPYFKFPTDFILMERFELHILLSSQLSGILLTFIHDEFKSFPANVNIIGTITNIIVDTIISAANEDNASFRYFQNFVFARKTSLIVWFKWWDRHILNGCDITYELRQNAISKRMRFLVCGSYNHHDCHTMRCWKDGWRLGIWVQSLYMMYINPSTNRIHRCQSSPWSQLHEDRFPEDNPWS